MSGIRVEGTTAHHITRPVLPPVQSSRAKGSAPLRRFVDAAKELAVRAMK
jgi:hypothetical protein